MWVIYEYWFARMKNISDSKKKKLREAYGSAKEIYYIEETQLRLQNFLTKKDIEQLKMARKQKDLEEKYYNIVKETFNKDFVGEFFDVQKINALLDDHFNNKENNGRKVYTIYTFLKWYEQYFI